MFGQNTMWGDAGPMDSVNIYQPESSYYEERYDYLDDSDLDDSDLDDNDNDYESEININIFLWQVRINRVHDELLSNH